MEIEYEVGDEVTMDFASDVFNGNDIPEGAIFTIAQVDEEDEDSTYAVNGPGCRNWWVDNWHIEGLYVKKTIHIGGE